MSKEELSYQKQFIIVIVAVVLSSRHYLKVNLMKYTAQNVAVFSMLKMDILKNPSFIEHLSAILCLFPLAVQLQVCLVALERVNADKYRTVHPGTLSCGLW